MQYAASRDSLPNPRVDHKYMFSSVMRQVSAGLRPFELTGSGLYARMQGRSRCAKFTSRFRCSDLHRLIA